MNYSLGKANPYQQFYRLVNPSNRMYRCNNVFECTFSWEQYKHQFKWKCKNVLFYPNCNLVYKYHFLCFNVDQMRLTYWKIIFSYTMKEWKSKIKLRAFEAMQVLLITRSVYITRAIIRLEKRCEHMRQYQFSYTKHVFILLLT